MPCKKKKASPTTYQKEGFRGGEAVPISLTIERESDTGKMKKVCRSQKGKGAGGENDEILECPRELGGKARRKI